MSFTLVAYDVLKASIKESVKTLVRSHGLHPSQWEESVKLLHAERRIPAMFLLKTISLLDASDKPLEQARILNAAAYFIRDQIGHTYSYGSPERSTFYNSLTTSLGLNKENKPERDDLVEMYSPLKRFLRKGVYMYVGPKLVYLDVQLFNIEGYSAAKDLEVLSNNLQGWETEATKEAEALYLKRLDVNKSIAPPRGLFGGLFGSSSSAPKEESKKMAPGPKEELNEEPKNMAPAPKEALKEESKKMAPGPSEGPKEKVLAPAF